MEEKHDSLGISKIKLGHTVITITFIFKCNFTRVSFAPYIHSVLSCLQISTFCAFKGSIFNAIYAWVVPNGADITCGVGSKNSGQMQHQEPAIDQDRSCLWQAIVTLVCVFLNRLISEEEHDNLGIGLVHILGKNFS